MLLCIHLFLGILHVIQICHSVSVCFGKSEMMDGARAGIKVEKHEPLLTVWIYSSAPATCIPGI